MTDLTELARRLAQLDRQAQPAPWIEGDWTIFQDLSAEGMPDEPVDLDDSGPLIVALLNSVPTLLQALAVQHAVGGADGADDECAARRFNQRADELLAGWTR